MSLSMKRLSAVVIGVFAVGCGGGQEEQGQQPETTVPVEGAAEPETGHVESAVVYATLQAGEVREFPTYVMWGWTSWKVFNPSYSSSVPYSVQCDNKMTQGELAPRGTRQEAWQCWGHTMYIRNMGTIVGTHIVDATTW